MADQLPLITDNRNLDTSAKSSTSLIGRGLSTIQSKAIFTAKTKLDVRYRQAREIYNRITFFGWSIGMLNEELLDSHKQLDIFEDNLMFYSEDLQRVHVFKEFQKLADLDYGQAYFPLSRLYFQRKGLSKPIRRNKYHIYRDLAFDWCFDNRDIVNPDSWTDLGWMLYSAGLGDVEKGIFWLQKAADHGHIGAQTELGHIYFCGYVIEQDYKQAEFWFLKAAELGGAVAQNFMGDIYSNGIGVEQNDEKAVFWYLKSAAQGWTNGQCNIASMYADGRGVECDKAKAVYWYSKAAECGYNKAREALLKLGVNWRDE